MTLYTSVDTILYFGNKNSKVIATVQEFAKANGYMLCNADGIEDVIATPFKVAILEKECLEPWYYDFLRHTHATVAVTDLTQDSDVAIAQYFNELLILLGDLSDIPCDLQHLFLYYPKLNMHDLNNLVSTKGTTS